MLHLSHLRFKAEGPGSLLECERARREMLRACSAVCIALFRGGRARVTPDQRLEVVAAALPFLTQHTVSRVHEDEALL